MSPAEALFGTAWGPGRGASCPSPESAPLGTIGRRSEDRAETSEGPGLRAPGTSSNRNPAAPFGGPGRDHKEPSKRPASHGTGAGPGRDRCRTVARPAMVHVGQSLNVARGRGGLRSALEFVGAETFADVATARREPSQLGGERSPRVPRSGRLPGQRPPEGPGHSGAKRVNVIRGYDIPCLGVPEAPTTGCRGPVVGEHPETRNGALQRWSRPRSGRGPRPSLERCRAVQPGTDWRPKTSPN